MPMRTVGARFKLEGEDEFKRTIQQLNAGSATLRSEMNRLQAEYKGNSSSIEFLTEKSELLTRTLNQQSEKTAATRAMYESASKAWADAAKRVEELGSATGTSTEEMNRAKAALADADLTMQKYAAALNNAEAEELKLNKAIEETQYAIDTNQEALESLGMATRTLDSEMQKLEAEYRGNTESTEFLTKKSDLLDKKLSTQQQTVQSLRDTVKTLTEKYGENDKRTQEWTQKLNQAEAAEFDLKHQIDSTNKSLNGQGKEMRGLGDVVGDLTQRLGIRLPQSATNALNGMSKLSAGTVAAMGASAAAVMALVKTVKQLQSETIDAAARADEILTRSTQMNMSASQYQALQYAAPFVDVDVDTLAGSLQKLTTAMGDAAAGSEAAQAKFSELGVSITNTDGTLRNAYDVWLDTMDALAEITNETERDVAAQDLLGKSSSQLATIYRDGTGALREYSKAAEENYIISDENLELLASVDDAVEHLRKTQEANKNMIAAEWAPAAKSALESFDRLVAAAGKALVDSGLIEGFGNLLQLATGLLDPIADLLGAADEAPGRLQPLKEAINGIALMIAAAADAVEWFAGALQTLTVVGAFIDIGGKTGIERMTHAAGYGYESGNANRFQRQRMINAGTWDQYASYYGLNASGNDNWRGGLTWVGEAGPELVALPRGSQILNAQDTRNAGGTTNYYINVNGIQELEQVLNWFQSRQADARMR